MIFYLVNQPRVCLHWIAFKYLNNGSCGNPHRKSSHSPLNKRVKLNGNNISFFIKKTSHRHTKTLIRKWSRVKCFSRCDVNFNPNTCYGVDNIVSINSPRLVGSYSNRTFAPLSVVVDMMWVLGNGKWFKVLNYSCQYWIYRQGDSGAMKLKYLIFMSNVKMISLVDVLLSHISI